MGHSDDVEISPLFFLIRSGSCNAHREEETAWCVFDEMITEIRAHVHSNRVLAKRISCWRVQVHVGGTFSHWSVGSRAVRALTRERGREADFQLKD